VAIWTLATKEIRVLLRDRLAALILLALPLLFILVLGLLLGEGFGQKPDDLLLISVVDLDEGNGLTPGEPWSRMVERDLAETAGIKVKTIPSLELAEELVRDHKRAAVLVFLPGFSDHINQCSFLADGINPFHRDGVYLDKIEARVLTDSKQPGTAAVIEQVAQVTLLRVILPYMIGRAFDRLSDPEFIKILGQEVKLPVPQVPGFELIYSKLIVTNEKGEKRIKLQSLLELASSRDAKKTQEYQDKVGEGVQNALKEQFKNYNLRGKTWAALTKSLAKDGGGAGLGEYVNEDGSGLLKRGARRYQVLVPAYTVMFAFFLVMNVGWVFVSERRQGTLKRLRASPVTRGQLLLGKLLPYYLVSLGQGAFLLAAGRALFGMRWGPDDWPLWQQVALLVPVIATTSLAAMGMALLVAAVARTEMQVALYGAVPVLVLALIGGCVLPREMMPEQAQQFSLITPQGWALDAYRELLDADPNYRPNLSIVGEACGVLALFGVVFTGLAWGLLRLD
jgi:ABC-type multidrug transport system permease subunit